MNAAFGDGGGVGLRPGVDGRASGNAKQAVRGEGGRRRRTDEPAETAEENEGERKKRVVLVMRRWWSILDGPNPLRLYIGLGV